MNKIKPSDGIIDKKFNNIKNTNKEPSFFFDMDSILSVQENMTNSEFQFAEKYLKDIIVEIKDKEAVIFPINKETLEYFIIHITRSHTIFNK